MMFEPFVPVRDIVDVVYPEEKHFRQEEKNYYERQAARAALMKMDPTERKRIEVMANTLQQMCRGMGEPSALIILFRMGAFLAKNQREHGKA